MSDFEKAVRYLYFAEAEDDITRVCRYEDINSMVQGDYAMIKKYAKKYEMLLDLLNS